MPCRCCYGGPPVLKEQIFLDEGPTFQLKLSLLRPYFKEERVVFHERYFCRYPGRHMYEQHDRKNIHVHSYTGWHIHTTQLACHLKNYSQLPRKPLYSSQFAVHINRYCYKFVQSCAQNVTRSVYISKHPSWKPGSTCLIYNFLISPCTTTHTHLSQFKCYKCLFCQFFQLIFHWRI